MNRTRLIFIGILALALGAFASALAYRVLQQRNAAAPGGQDVVVATHDISAGARIQDKDIRLVHLPLDVVPPSSFHRKDGHVLGRGVVLPIAGGEFILAGKLAAENGGSGLPSMIPPGMRAATTQSYP